MDIKGILGNILKNDLDINVPSASIHLIRWEGKVQLYSLNVKLSSISFPKILAIVPKVPNANLKAKHLERACTQKEEIGEAK